MKNVTPFVKKLKEIDTVEYWLLLRFQMDCISAELNASSHAGFVKRISVNHPELKCFDLTVHMVFNGIAVIFLLNQSIENQKKLKMVLI